MSTEKTPRGVQALESSGKLLMALSTARQTLSLRDLAQAAEMPAAKAFPHLVSLVKTGLLQRDEHGNYGVGALSLELGLLALQRLSPTREAGQEILHIAQSTGLSVATCVLGPLGPTVIQLEEAAQPQHISLRIGTVLSMVNTAIGRVFAAYLPTDVLSQLLRQDAIRMAGQFGHDKVVDDSDNWRTAYQHRLESVRLLGLDNAVDKPVPGIHTLAAPVFNHAGEIVLVIAVMGSAGVFDSSTHGKMATFLRERGAALSHRLGYATHIAVHGSLPD